MKTLESLNELVSLIDNLKQGDSSEFEVNKIKIKQKILFLINNCVNDLVIEPNGDLNNQVYNSQRVLAVLSTLNDVIDNDVNNL